MLLSIVRGPECFSPNSELITPNLPNQFEQGVNHGKNFHAKDSDGEGIEAASTGGASMDGESCLQELRILPKTF